MSLRATSSPQAGARLAGCLYVIVIIAGAYAELGVRGQLVVANDAAATAHNIMTHPLQYRLGFVAELLEILCSVPLAVIFYDLFKVVNEGLIRMAVFLSLVATAIEAVNLLNHLAPLALLSGKSYLDVIPPAELAAQAYLSLNLFELGFAITLVFFGFFCLLLGYLIVRSGFLPWIIGVLLAGEGLCYLANSLAVFLAPQYAALVFSVLAVSVIGEISLGLWLLVMGIDVAKWQARAAMARRD